MRFPIAVVALFLFAIGCAADRGDGRAPNASAVAEVREAAPETFALGTDVTAAGAVPREAAAETFVRGSEIYLSVDVSGASTSQNIEVKWVDPDGRVLRRDAELAPQGSQFVPFSSGETAQWPRGAYRAVVIIDGRTVSEKQFAML